MSRIDLEERPSSRDELAGWYAAALDAQSRSGLSVTGYAEQIGVTAATLYQWRRRLASSAAVGPSRAKLVEVTIASPNREVARTAVVVRICDGRRSIDVPRGFDSDELCRLITTLESC
jgi:hypothetical protein